MLISSMTPSRTQIMNQSQLINEVNTAIQTRTQTQLRINNTEVNINQTCVCVNATVIPQQIRLSNQEMTISGMQVTDATTGVKAEVMAKINTQFGIKSVNMVQEQNQMRIMEEGSNVSVSLALNHQVRLENNTLILNKSGIDKVLTVLPLQAMNQLKATNQTIRSMELVMEQEQAVYKITEQRQARLFGFIPIGMEVASRVSAENGTLMGQAKPWWSFLATE